MQVLEDLAAVVASASDGIFPSISEAYSTLTQVLAVTAEEGFPVLPRLGWTKDLRTGITSPYERLPFRRWDLSSSQISKFAFPSK